MMNIRARRDILSYITSFCLSRNYGTGANVGGLSENHFLPLEVPKVGDLVSLQSAPVSEWYLSWYLEEIPRNDSFDTIHVLESVDTGELCNWSNVSFSVLNRSVVANHPEWRWSDKQYEFKDRWFNACYRKRNAYIDRPCKPEFREDGSVTLSTRKMFDYGEGSSRIFDNWKKVLVRDMLEFYDSIGEDGIVNN